MVSLDGGYPSKSAVTLNGAAAPFRVAGKATYGPGGLTAQYHFDLWRINPDLGGGVGSAFIFGTDDAAIHNLKIGGSFGPIPQGGFGVPVSRHLSLFTDLKKMWVSVDARGDLPAAGIGGGEATAIAVELR